MNDRIAVMTAKRQREGGTGRQQGADLHSPLGRDFAGAAGWRPAPHGAGYPLPVRQASKPTSGLIQQKENTR